MKPHEHVHGHEERLKDQHERHNHLKEGLSSDLQGFYGELSQVFPDTDIRITSGRRSVSPSGGFSHHHHGDAIDIGKEHSDVFHYLYNTPEGLGLMDKYGLGILDETNPDTLKKTGGTGPHFHIGKDSGLSTKTKNRMNNYENVNEVHSFYSQNPAYDYRKKKEEQDANFNLSTGMRPTETISNTLESVGGVEVVLPNNHAGQMFLKSLQQEKDKNAIVKKKNEQQPARAALEAKQMAANQRRERLINTMANVRRRDQRVQAHSGQSQGLPPSRVDIDIQQDLPDLPGLFS